MSKRSLDGDDYSYDRLRRSDCCRCDARLQLAFNVAFTGLALLLLALAITTPGPSHSGAALSAFTLCIQLLCLFINVAVLAGRTRRCDDKALRNLGSIGLFSLVLGACALALYLSLAIVLAQPVRYVPAAEEDSGDSPAPTHGRTKGAALQNYWLTAGAAVLALRAGLMLFLGAHQISRLNSPKSRIKDRSSVVKDNSNCSLVVASQTGDQPKTVLVHLPSQPKPASWHTVAASRLAHVPHAPVIVAQTPHAVDARHQATAGASMRSTVAGQDGRFANGESTAPSSSSLSDCDSTEPDYLSSRV